MDQWLKDKIRADFKADFKKVRSRKDLVKLEEVYGQYLPSGFLETVWDDMTKRAKTLKAKAAGKKLKAAEAAHKKAMAKKKAAAKKKASAKKKAVKKTAKKKTKKTRVHTAGMLQ